MRILLKLVLDCEPDAAWRAIRSPSVLTDVSAPLTTFTALDPDGFPDVWSEGDHLAQVKAFGLVPLGEQVISVSFSEPKPGVRMMVDAGIGLSGPLAVIDSWHHSLAVAAAPGGKTLYRDQLVFSAGPLTLLMWPVYWAFWQWRAVGLRRLAPTWRA